MDQNHLAICRRKVNSSILFWSYNSKILLKLVNISAVSNHKMVLKTRKYPQIINITKFFFELRNSYLKACKNEYLEVRYYKLLKLAGGQGCHLNSTQAPKYTGNAFNAHNMCEKFWIHAVYHDISNKLCIFRLKIYRKHRKAHRNVKILNLIQVKF
jgi:hypothetical protein